MGGGKIFEILGGGEQKENFSKFWGGGGMGGGTTKVLGGEFPPHTPPRLGLGK